MPSLVDGGVYEFESIVAPGKSLERVRGGHAAGTNVIIWMDAPVLQRPLDGAPPDGWPLCFVPNNAPAMHLNVDLSGGGGGTGSNVQIYNTNNENSHWVPELECRRQFRRDHPAAIIRPCALNVAGGVNADGTNVTVSNDNNTKSQRWRLIKRN